MEVTICKVEDSGLNLSHFFGRPTITKPAVTTSFQDYYLQYLAFSFFFSQFSLRTLQRSAISGLQNGVRP